MRQHDKGSYRGSGRVGDVRILKCRSEAFGLDRHFFNFPFDVNFFAPAVLPMFRPSGTYSWLRGTLNFPSEFVQKKSDQRKRSTKQIRN